MTDENIVSTDSLSQKKQTFLENSTANPKMYLSIENTVNDPSLKCTIYIIEIGIQKGQNVHTHHVHKRYSAINTFDELIRPALNYPRELQPFPPKKIIGNKDTEFINQRSQALQSYILSLLRVPGMINLPAFLRFFEIDSNKLTNQ